MAEHDPTLTYLPHLDYDLLRFGPDESNPRVRRSLTDIDAVAGDLADAARASGRSVVVLSEYGITQVDRRSTSTGCCAMQDCSWSAKKTAARRSIR
jgi:predicted AlkP superfamily pyrophosphatase or phosphodiesterase